MKPYILSLAVGLLVGVIYGGLGVRSPAPPAIALLGLLGMLLGEQGVPIAKHVLAGRELVAFLKSDCAEHVLGQPIEPRKDA